MKKYICLVCLVLLSACSTNHGTFTVASNKIVDLNNFDANGTRKMKNVIGEDKAHIISFIPVGSMNPNVGEAMNDAFRKTDTDLMTDVTVKSWFFYIPYIYGQIGWKVQGDAVKTRSR
jgi:hypothetical protein